MIRLVTLCITSVCPRITVYSTSSRKIILLLLIMRSTKWKGVKIKQKLENFILF